MTRSAKLRRVYLAVPQLDYVAGVEQIVASLAVALSRAGLEVTVLSVRPVPTDVIYASALPAAGVGLVSGRSGRDGTFWDRFVEVARRSPPDVVHVHGFRLDTVWLAARAAEAAMPVVYTEHATLDEADEFYAPIADSAWPALAVAHQLSCLSDHTADLLRAVLPPGAPIARSHAAVTGPPAWAPPPVDGPSVTAEPLRVVCTARLSPEKGVDVLVEAVGRLTAKGVPVTLDLAAQGPDRTALEDLAGRLGISSAVTFRGGYDPRQLATILGAGHVLALTSHTEGAPLSVVEALAHGVPVVATSVGGTAQLVHDGENGVLVPPGDVDAVADALGELARDPARRRRLAVGARNSYLAGPHTPGRVVDEALALYGRARLAALASSPDEMRPSTSRRTASRPRPQA